VQEGTAKDLDMESTITFSAEATLIEQASAKARRENKTLNDLFQEWLRSYVEGHGSLDRYVDLMRQLQYVSSGGKFSRDESNQR
jgi:hypothetical protein